MFVITQTRGRTLRDRLYLAVPCWAAAILWPGVLRVVTSLTSGLSELPAACSWAKTKSVEGAFAASAVEMAAQS